MLRQAGQEIGGQGEPAGGRRVGEAVRGDVDDRAVCGIVPDQPQVFPRQRIDVGTPDHAGQDVAVGRLRLEVATEGALETPDQLLRRDRLNTAKGYVIIATTDRLLLLDFAIYLKYRHIVHYPPTRLYGRPPSQFSPVSRVRHARILTPCFTIRRVANHPEFH